MARVVYAPVANRASYFTRVGVYEDATLEEVIASDAAKLRGARIFDGELAEFPPMIHLLRLLNFRLVWSSDGVNSPQKEA